MGNDKNTFSAGQEPTNKAKRPYHHYPIGTDDQKINDSEYTERVKKRLQRNLGSILSFTYCWQIWLIRHPDFLPNPSKNSPKSALKDPRLDRLLRLLIDKISVTERFSKAEKDSLIILITDIYEKDGWTVDNDIRKIINDLFMGKVEE